MSWLEGFRARAWFDGFSLDLKLGGRMLVKYPGLTIVGGLAMAFAICVGTVIFAVLTMLLHPTLPLPGGERIVQIRAILTRENPGGLLFRVSSIDGDPKGAFAMQQKFVADMMKSVSAQARNLGAPLPARNAAA